MKKEPIDTGAERLHHHRTVVPRRRADGYNMRVMDETEIDRMLMRDEITPNEHATLERLMGKLHKFGFMGVRSPDYSSPIHADASAVGDKKAATIRGAVKLTKELDAALGADLRRRLYALILEDKGVSAEDLRKFIDVLNTIG